MTVEQQTEHFFTKFAASLATETEMLDKAMGPSVAAIREGTVTTQSRNTLLEALADLEQACATFRWAAANAAMRARDATPSVDVGLLVHTRWQNALDYIEGHAVTLIEIVARMRKNGEERDDVLDVRQHIKRLVDLGKSLELPRKPRKK